MWRAGMRRCWLLRAKVGLSIRKCDPDGHLPRDYPPGSHSQGICSFLAGLEPECHKIFSRAKSFQQVPFYVDSSA